MRYVIVPEPVLVVNPITKERATKSATDATPDDPHSLFVFLSTLVIQDPGMPKGVAGARMSNRLWDLFEHALPGDVVAVESADWEAVKKIIESPELKWNHMVAGQLIPIIDAWLDAKETAPATEEESQ